jgi:flagellin-specific chaperone FliS
MIAYRVYQEQAKSAWLRIDLLLQLYDATIAKLEAARAALAAGDTSTARTLLERTRLLLGGLVSIVDPGRGEMANQFLRLYEFVNHALDSGRLDKVEGAVRVLRTLREALEAIRPEAAELERSGRIPPADAKSSLQLTV